MWVLYTDRGWAAVTRAGLGQRLATPGPTHLPLCHHHCNQHQADAGREALEDSVGYDQPPIQQKVLDWDQRGPTYVNVLWAPLSVLPAPEACQG